MEQFKLAMVVLIWAGLLMCLVTGYFYSPNFRVRRSDDPKSYWAFMGTSAVAGVIATILISRLG